MTRADNRLASLAALVLLLSFTLAGCGVLREPSPTPAPTTVAQVTADQVAQAMEADSFYATYGHTTLLVSGTVAGVDPGPGHFIITLGTNETTQVLCDLGGQSPAIKFGDTLTVRSADPENDVLRQNGDVIIQNCTLAH